MLSAAAGTYAADFVGLSGFRELVGPATLQLSTLVLLQIAAVPTALMVGFCVVTGSLLGWLRLRSDSVWPCAIGHGFLNASARLPLLFFAAGTTFDNASVGLLGWPGWIVMALAFGLVAVLTRRGRLASAR